MAKYSKSSFDSLYVATNGTFADNNTRDISEGDLRQFALDIKDSVPFLQGGGAVITERKVMTGAMIRGSYSSPITLVSTPGAGFTLVPIKFYFFYDYDNFAAYSGSTTFNITLGSVAVIGNDASLLTLTADRYKTTVAIDIDTNTNVSNQPLTFQLTGADASGGNSLVYLTVVYSIVQNA
jgi:hypothetical protein